jgi:MOSC domain-containing protein YiiM
MVGTCITKDQDSPLQGGVRLTWISSRENGSGDKAAADSGNCGPMRASRMFRLHAAPEKFMAHEILTVLTGKVRPFRGADEPSAIVKLPVEGNIPVGLPGLQGDEQADLVHHGGRDKAIHHYPFDHYPEWRSELGGHPLLGQPGAFGENISTLGLVEQDVCIADVFRLGTALVEVSQGRQPCWKLGHRFGNPDVTARVVATRRSGWYYRVLEPGHVASGDVLELLERPLPDWSVARVFGLLIGGDGKREPAALRALAELQVLAEPWRRRASELLG